MANRGSVEGAEMLENECISDSSDSSLSNFGKSNGNLMRLSDMKVQTDEVIEPVDAEDDSGSLDGERVAQVAQTPSILRDKKKKTLLGSGADFLRS